MDRQKIARALERRPSPAEFRQQVTWLVDVILACRTSKDPELVDKAQLLERALGELGVFLETGDHAQLAAAHSDLQHFTAFVQQPAQSGA